MSYSRVTARLCGVSQRTVLSMTHGGAAARPKLLSAGNMHNLNPKSKAEPAVCTLGAHNGKLRENLEISIRAEAGSTLMVDSVMPVKLLPHEKHQEYGIGIHAGVESGALLVVAPDAHVPHADAHTGLWTRYDLSPEASIVSVQLADLKLQASRPPAIGGRYTSRTRVHHATIPGIIDSTSGGAPPQGRAFTAEDSLEVINPSCARPSVSSCGLLFSAEPSWSCDWTYGRRFKGISGIGTPSTNVIASVVLAGPRAEEVIESFKGISERPSTHQALGMLGEVHLAVQDVQLRSGNMVIVRAGTEHREDMHRLMHHALLPLEGQLGVMPYSRHILSASTAPRSIATGSWFRGAAEDQGRSDNLGLSVQRIMNVQHVPTAQASDASA